MTINADDILNAPVVCDEVVSKPQKSAPLPNHTAWTPKPAEPQAAPVRRCAPHPPAPWPGYRQERIQRLLEEIKYEFSRGVMEGETPEQMLYAFYLPSKYGNMRAEIRFMHDPYYYRYYDMGFRPPALLKA